MSHEINQSDSKGIYEPPQLKTISLRPEEAVLGHCKSTSSGTYAPGNCAAILGLCNSVGS